MSRRREIARRLQALSEITGIMSAMKGVALMETRILMDFMSSLRRMVSGIEAAASEFVASHPGFADASGTRPELCVLVGSEQGFCGDFNEALLSRIESMSEEKGAPVRWLVIGQRLASRLGERGCIELTLPGAVVADEVPAVLQRLTRALSALFARPELAGYGLSALHHCDSSGDIRMQRVLPLRDLPAPGRGHPYPVELNLVPEDFFRGLTGYHLHAILNEVLYSSLMVENRQRQAHMDRALQRLSDDSARLKLAYNTQRQEEITEEIEVILLSAEMLSEAHYR